ncbi:MAG: phytoene/squalene synthase family protein [Candidatus Hodarchaeota archaeon]
MYSSQKTIDWGLVPENMQSKYNLIDKTLEESYQVCLDWMAEHSKSFYFASRFLPTDQRKSVAALYAVCRLSDDIVDEAPEGITIDQINYELDQLKQTITKLANGYSSRNPILRAFGDTLRRHKIPVDYMHELIEGVRMDLTKNQYYSEEELDIYMFRVASTVGLMMTHIFIKNPAKRTLARAADLGRAMQLTNILRDIKEDFLMGRIYLPEETRNDYEVTIEDLNSDKVNENLKSLIRYESERAKAFYRIADLGIEELPPAAAYTVKVASSVYGEILNEIERRDYQILNQRAVVSKLRKIFLAVKVRLNYFRKL